MTKAMANKAAEKSQNNWSMKVMMTIAFIVMALTFSFTAMAGSRKVQPGRYYKDEETAMVTQLNDILGKYYKSIGIGCYTTEAGETYWAQEFGF